jgi:hypothetical protein
MEWSVGAEGHVPSFGKVTHLIEPLILLSLDVAAPFREVQVSATVIYMSDHKP